MNLKTTIFGLGLAIFSATVSAHAQTSPSLGRKIELIKKADGAPTFGLQYASGRDAFVAITMAMKGNQLISGASGNVTPSYWTIVDKSTLTAITDWQPTSLNGSAFTADATVAMTLSVSKNFAAVVPKKLAKSAIVFSLNTAGAPTASVYIDVAELCLANPNQFMNLDTIASGCP